MKNIVIANQKGGVGKTLISDELAFMFEADEVKLSFYDLDQQGGTLHDTISNEDAAVAIVDTPGALMEDSAKWISEADLVIIPTLMSNRDAAPLLRMMELVEKNKKKDAAVLVILNKWNQYTTCKDFIEWFDRSFPEVKTAIINDTPTFNQASACRQSIQTYNRRCKGAKQLAQIYGWIKTQLGIKEGWAIK